MMKSPQIAPLEATETIPTQKSLEKSVENASGSEKSHVPEDAYASLGALHPFKWSSTRKWSVVMIVSLMSAINTTATLICTPAVPHILSDLQADGQAYTTLLVSVWELGEGFGPFLIGPLSEMFGRVPVWHTCNMLFSICSIGCALSRNIHMLVAFRFLNGFVVGSITLGPAIMGDMFPVEQRGTVLSIAKMLPTIGPTIGPFIGSEINHHIGWRWIFWTIAITVGVFEVPSVLIMRETYKPKLMRRHRARNDIEEPHHPLPIEPKSKSWRTLIRAVRIWIYFPIVFGLALFLAICYGYQYLVYTTISEVLTKQYNFTDDIIGLCFVGIGFGIVLGLLIYGPTSDWYVKKMKKRFGRTVPEYRIPPLALGTVLTASSLFLYGWTAQNSVHWMAPISGTALQGFGLVFIVMSTQTYLVDAFPDHAASAIAAGSVLKSIAGAILPFAGPPLYSRLGLGWGNTLLGLTCILILPVPFLFWSRGENSRSRNSPGLVL